MYRYVCWYVDLTKGGLDDQEIQDICGAIEDKLRSIGITNFPVNVTVGPNYKEANS